MPEFSESVAQLIIIAIGATAVLAAGFIGVFTWRRIVGPDRLGDGPLQPLVVTALAGLVGWMLVPALLILPDRQISATAPATERADDEDELTPAQQVKFGVVSAGAGLLAVLVVGSIADRRLLPRLGLSLRQIPAGVMFGVGGALILIPITFAATILTEWLWQRLGVEHPQAHKLLEILRDADARVMRAMIFGSALVLAPLFEEIFFRGCVQTLFVGFFDRLFRPTGFVVTPFLGLKLQALARWLAVVTASLAFAGVHAPWMIPPILVLSLGMGYAYERTGNLWTPIVMHAAFNLINVLLFVNYLVGSN